jgi:hypothetical protein
VNALPVSLRLQTDAKHWLRRGGGNGLACSWAAEVKERLRCAAGQASGNSATGCTCATLRHWWWMPCVVADG